MLQEADYLDLIGKYLSGNIHPEEAEQLVRWRNASEANERLFKQYSRVWILSASTPEPILSGDLEQSWEKVQQSIRQQAPENSNTILPPRTTQLQSRSWWIAAAAIAFLLLGWNARKWLLPIPPASPWVLAYTTSDEQKTIQLPDGSTVWLNKHSKIWHHPDFTSNRKVRLEGEAFFEVIHAPKRPFSIESNGLTTKVLGTSFNIRAYPEEPEVEVSVKTGIVQLYAPANLKGSKATLRIDAGKSARFRTKVQTLEVQTAPLPNVLAWKEAHLYFDGTPLLEILPTLERYFEIKTAILDPGLETCTFNGNFEHPELEQVLNTLQIALELEIQQTNGVYTFSGAPCR